MWPPVGTDWGLATLVHASQHEPRMPRGGASPRAGCCTRRMTSYLVTGATGFIGRRLVERLLVREDAEIFALVRAASQQRFDEISRSWPGGDRVTPVIGDVTSPGAGLSDGIRERLSGIDHVIHLAALYDITARPAINETTNVTGTRNVVDLANELGARRLHHCALAEHRHQITLAFVAGDDDRKRDDAARMPSRNLERRGAARPDAGRASDRPAPVQHPR